MAKEKLLKEIAQAKEIIQTWIDANQDEDGVDGQALDSIMELGEDSSFLSGLNEVLLLSDGDEYTDGQFLEIIETFIIKKETLLKEDNMFDFENLSFNRFFDEHKNN